MKPTTAAASNAVSRDADFASEQPVWLGRATAREENAPAIHLTPRQLEVLSLLGEGLPNKLICRQLNISTGTVKVHISCILRELGVTSRLQAVVRARRCGILGALDAGVSGEQADPRLQS